MEELVKQIEKLKADITRSRGAMPRFFAFNTWEARAW